MGLKVWLSIGLKSGLVDISRQPLQPAILVMKSLLPVSIKYVCGCFGSPRYSYTS